MDKRSCFLCKNSTICFVFRDIKNTTSDIPINIDGDAAPGQWKDVFSSMANCCLKFNPNK